MIPQDAARTLGRRFLRYGKAFVGEYPALMPLYLRLTPEGTTRALSADTQLVVEGFPRSGTTFAAHSLSMAQPIAPKTTFHVHNVAVLRQATEQRIPTVLVVRTPVDCLASYLTWDPRIGAGTVLWEWIRYHRSALAVSHDLTVATFDQVTTDLPAVVARLNGRFGASFTAPPSTEAFDRDVRRSITTRHAQLYPNNDPSIGVPVPDAGRQAELARQRDALRNPAVSAELVEAEALFDRYAALAQRDR